MKLTSLFLIAVYLHVSAASYGQKVTISGKDMPLEKVFNTIRKQTGYVFFYDYNILRNAKNVTVDLREAEIDEAMRTCLQGQDLEFDITNKTISVVRSEGEKKRVAINDAEKLIKAYGFVFNEAGQPLSGASVTVEQTHKAAITNARGQFELSAPVNSTLLISFIGYAVEKVPLKESTTIEVYLKVTKNELDKVVIQAYGTTTQRLTTGNIGRVSSADLEKQPVMNPLLALQGKIAGLDVSQTNGYATAPLKIELRGRNIIGNFAPDPLYVIDGVPLTILDVGGSSGYVRSTGFFQFGGGFNGPASGQSPFFSLNSSDIESIEVLKDADATAIYGSRAANGVILITTKKGKAGKTKFDMHVNEGVTKVSRYYNLLNTQQYLAMRKQAFYNDSIAYAITPNMGNAYDLLSWDTTRYTDWQRKLYGGTGKTTDVEASLSGGDVNTTFRIAAGYNKVTNILAVSGSDQRGSLSFNINHRSSDQKFSIALTGTYSSSKSDVIAMPGSVTYAPNSPAIYDSAGNLNYHDWNVSGNYPFATLKQPYSSKTDLLNSNLSINYQPMKGLSIRTSMGYNIDHSILKNFGTIASQDPATNPTGSSMFGNSSNENWLIEPQIDYNTFLSKGKFNVLVGASYQQTNTDGGYVGGAGYTSDALLYTISNAPVQGASANSAQYKYGAVFGRINYNWENKYLINLNARRDGSSRFGEDNQFGNFGSIGAAWIFTEENFFKDNLSFISFGKLRTSYGTTGSDAVGDYKYLTRWTSSGTQPYGNILPVRPTQHANPNYQWQVNKKFEGAIDLGFLKDWITLSTSYYRNRCGNQLISFPLPNITGFNNVTANSPALVQNEGWEFLLSSKIIDGKNFTWSVSFNTAINSNKLVAYPHLESSPYANSLVVGQSLNIVKLLHYTGVDPQKGIYTFYDKNHDGTINDDPGSPDNDYYNYDLSPKFFGGLGTNCTFSGISVSLYFYFKKQRGRNSISQSDIPGNIANQPASIWNQQWQAPGDKATIARFTTQPDATDFFFQAESDGAYTDASYIRLSNLSVSYDFPSSFVKKAGMQKLSLYVRTNNIFTITKYKGIDPETQNFGGMPSTKTIVGGISLNF